ncbi:MAG: UDP-3-O-(3-hydroxymyristoyl)glucosamine N-acyltransferase [Candidatus Melainabacteria bacterium]|nr:UDP-3-O-(3-hydroxymyristoyl)glucosamine N-acyltransferase [Candidatus Melainabacteria bacterium]
MPSVSPKTLEEIASAIDGEVFQRQDQKNKSLVIDSLAVSPEHSTVNDLVIVFDQKYFKNLTKIKAKSMILPSEMKDKISLNVPVILVKRPRIVLKKLLEFFSKPKYLPGAGIHKSCIIDPSSSISKTSSIGANVFIGPKSTIGEKTAICPNVYIGSNVVIGENCLIYPNCTILDNTRIGNNVILHSGVVAGADGYSYVTEEESNLEKAKKGDFNFNLGRQVQHKIPSIGNVIIEDDVEVGANTCIDSGTIGPTVIGSGTKIDNLVQVAHNCKIGKDCLIVGQVGFAGSVNLGDRVVVGGQTGFADNIDIGSDAIFVARSGVHGNIPPNSVYIGMPAVPYRDFIQSERTIKRLPRRYEKLEEQVKVLESKIKELEEKLSVKI